MGHQLFLLPFTAVFVLALGRMLFGSKTMTRNTDGLSRAALALLGAFTLCNLWALEYQVKHFAALGYSMPWPTALCVTIPFAFIFFYLSWQGTAHAGWVAGTALLSCLAQAIASIAYFPLNYLRSDMLPVILWADTNILHQVSPYERMFVGGRVYDFPYLPGMLIAYLPFAALHLDLRIGSLMYLIALAAIGYWAALPSRRLPVALLLGLFLLNPFLQYRHELYLEPHWLTMLAAFVLMRRGRFLVAAFVFGMGMAIYQFSWILFPFVLLYALRRRGWVQVFKEAVAAAAGALLLAAPFLRSASQRISNNAVGQWGRLPHALAEPMNLSYWVTFLIPPSQLLKLQAALMVLLFGYCLFAGRCRTLADTLRWMVVALTLFILLNVIVDGYFFLMLLVPMLAYVCVANEWWSAGQTTTATQAEPAG